MHRKSLSIVILSVILYHFGYGQLDSVRLQNVTISTGRIDIPFSQTSRTIEVITKEEIKQSGALNVADLLQGIGGIDIIRRGIDGTQSDIYIRGGHFNQVLILIDGFAVEDPQTGHHTTNVLPDPDDIQRIEIIKGPAARIYGQNAFSGAINIVTKGMDRPSFKISGFAGSYGRFGGGISVEGALGESSHRLSLTHLSSKGYRDNTDYNNTGIFYHGDVGVLGNQWQITGMYRSKKFGANNFYTFSPSFDEYEETKVGFVGITTKILRGKWVYKPRVYWKLGNDLFTLKRYDDSFPKNMNTSHKIGASIHSSRYGVHGVTGLGVDISRVALKSNNLGNHHRSIINGFLEHRLSFFDEALDITPGVSLHYYSDFGFHAFPGIDIGYHPTSSIRLYANAGYSYRVPTYTELYVDIPNFLSGSNTLRPEKSLGLELGTSYSGLGIFWSAAVFYRKSFDLIDYVKKEATSTIFLAENLRQIKTTGIELNANYKFILRGMNQDISVSYTFIDNKYGDIDVFASRYLVDRNIKHQFIARASFHIFDHLLSTVNLRHIVRPEIHYTVVDFSMRAQLGSLEFYMGLYNVLDTEYYEKLNVPMPGRNFMIGVSYGF